MIRVPVGMLENLVFCFIARNSGWTRLFGGCRHDLSFTEIIKGGQGVRTLCHSTVYE
jgi:hypothetical protein